MMGRLAVARKSVAKKPVALTIAGSDPSGGAGFQADLKTFAALKVYGFSVITAVIAQNSAKVVRVAPVDAAMVTAQLEALASERRPDALKTGALANAAVVLAVAEAIRALKMPAPVVDPVLIASSGARLLDADGEAAMRALIFPLARVVTPNIPEAEALSGVVIDGREAMRAAARALCRMGARAVVIKGGHPYTGGSGDGGGVRRASRRTPQPSWRRRDGHGPALRRPQLRRTRGRTYSRWRRAWHRMRVLSGNSGISGARR